jgi:hypothetical protein
MRKMKTLIYDKNSNDLDKLFNLIQNLPMKILTDKVSSFASFLTKYNEHKYDAIFIDFNNHIGMQIVQHIHNTDKKQNIILLNDVFSCFDKMNCIQCKTEYKRNVLIKPFNQKEIIRILLNHFDCDNFNKNETSFIIEKIKKEILIKYPNILFNYEHNEFELNNVQKPFKITALIDMIELLSKDKIKYKVCDENIQLNI